MQLVCSTCQAAFSAVSHCPRCGARLVTAHESGAITRGSRRRPPPVSVDPTAGGRVFMGVLVSLGVYLGLREWAVAGLSLAGIANTDWWNNEDGQWASLILRTVSVAIGGLVAGASRAEGWVLGLFAGGIASGLLLGADIAAKPTALGFMPFVMMGIATVTALVTGWFASNRWPAITPIAPVRGGSNGSSLLRLVQDEEQKKKKRPTQWWRLILAASVALSGVVAADEIRVVMIKASGGSLNLGSAFSAPVVCLELAVAALFFAGVFAGAGTGAGLRHGLIVGGVVAVAVVALTLVRSPHMFPAVEGFFWVLEVPLEAMCHALPQAELFILMWGTVAVGGMFGGTLLPPLASEAQRRRMHADA